MSKVQKTKPVKTDQISTNDGLSMRLDSPLKIINENGDTVQILDILHFKRAKDMSIDNILDARKFFNLAITSNSVKNQNIFLFDFFESIPPILDIEVAAENQVGGFLEALCSDLLFFATNIAPKILTYFLTDSNFKKAEGIVKNFRPIAAVIRNIKASPDDCIGFGHESLNDCIGLDLKEIDSGVFVACCYKLAEVCRVKKIPSVEPLAS